MMNTYFLPILIFVFGLSAQSAPLTCQILFQKAVAPRVYGVPVYTTPSFTYNSSAATSTLNVQQINELRRAAITYVPRLKAQTRDYSPANIKAIQETRLALHDKKHAEAQLPLYQKWMKTILNIRIPNWIKKIIALPSKSLTQEKFDEHNTSLTQLRVHYARPANALAMYGFAAHPPEGMTQQQFYVLGEVLADALKAAIAENGVQLALHRIEKLGRELLCERTTLCVLDAESFLSDLLADTRIVAERPSQINIKKFQKKKENSLLGYVLFHNYNPVVTTARERLKQLNQAIEEAQSQSENMTAEQKKFLNQKVYSSFVDALLTLPDKVLELHFKIQNYTPQTIENLKEAVRNLHFHLETLQTTYDEANQHLAELHNQVSSSLLSKIHEDIENVDTTELNSRELTKIRNPQAQ